MCIRDSVKRAGCGLALVALKETGCDVRQMECQASNVTATVQSDHLLHGYMLPVFFATDQSHHPPRCAEIQPMSQQDVLVTRLYRKLVLEMIRVKKRKRWKIYVWWVRQQQFVFFWDNVNNLKYVWTILLKNDFFGFPKVKWLQYTGEVGKCTSYWCQIFSEFNTSKIVKIG